MSKNERPFENIELEASLDLWTNFTVDNDLLDEIIQTGVVVYERE